MAQEGAQWPSVKTWITLVQSKNIMLITSGINFYQPMNNCLNTNVLYSPFYSKDLSNVYSTRQLANITYF